MSKEKTKNTKQIKQDQNTFEEQKPKNSIGMGHYSNIVSCTPLKTPEEHWKEVRETINPEYQTLFDSNNHSAFRHLLQEISLSKLNYIQTDLDTFKKLEEIDFIMLKNIHNVMKISPCPPANLAYDLFKKREYDKYKEITFTFPEETLDGLFSDKWRIDPFTIIF